MTQNISTTSFFSLDAPVQRQILMHLPFNELADSVSLVCKAFFQRSQEAVPDKALECIRSFKETYQADEAYTLVLKFYRNMPYYQKLNIIRNITDPQLRFDQCLSILPACPEAQKLAEETALSIQVKTKRDAAFLRLFKATKNLEHLKLTTPLQVTTPLQLELQDFKYQIKKLKTRLSIYKSDANTVKSIHNCALKIIAQLLFSKQLSITVNIYRILKLVDLTLNPEDYLLFLATKINEEFVHSKSISDKITYVVCLLIIELAYQKYIPVIDSDSLVRYKEIPKIKEILNELTLGGYDSIVAKLFDKAKQGNLSLARLVAHQANTSYKVEALLAIFERSKDVADLMEIPECVCLNFDTAILPIKIALHDIKDFIMARKIANLIISDEDKCKVFIEIFSTTKDVEDLAQAEKFLSSITDTCLKIKTLVYLFKITQDNKYQRLGVELIRDLNINVPDPNFNGEIKRVSGLIYLSILTNDFAELTSAFHLLIANDGFKIYPIEFFEIFKVCIEHFKNYEQACKFLQFADEQNSIDWDGLNGGELYFYVLNQFILQKRFDLALLIPTSK